MKVVPVVPKSIGQEMNRDPQDSIRLDQFLKFSGIAHTGGHAKLLIQQGEVLVNDQQETRRRRKVVPGDVIQVGDVVLTVESDE
jgi:ribosome-associated protein